MILKPNQTISKPNLHNLSLYATLIYSNSREWTCPNRDVNFSFKSTSDAFEDFRSWIQSIKDSNLSLFLVTWGQFISKKNYNYIKYINIKPFEKVTAYTISRLSIPKRPRTCQANVCLVPPGAHIQRQRLWLARWLMSRLSNLGVELKQM